MPSKDFPASDETVFLEAAFNRFVKDCDEQALHNKTTDRAPEELKALLDVTTTLRETTTALQGQLQTASNHHQATYDKLREEFQAANEKLRDGLQAKHSEELKALRETITALQRRMDDAQKINTQLQRANKHHQTAIEELREVSGDSEGLAELKKDLHQTQDVQKEHDACLWQLIDWTKNRVLIDPHHIENNTSRTPPGPNPKLNGDFEPDDHAVQLGENINPEVHRHIKAHQTRSSAPAPPQNRSRDPELGDLPSAVAPVRQRAPTPALEVSSRKNESSDKQAYQALRPRAKAVVDHYFAVRKQYSAAVKDQAKFVRAYIKGFKDPDFIAWFQKYLLKTLPEGMVRPTKGRTCRQPGSINIVFTNKVTWEAVKHATKDMDVDEFLEV